MDLYPKLARSSQLEFRSGRPKWICSWLLKPLIFHSKCDSLWLRRPCLIPVLLLYQVESKDLEGQADEDLGQNWAEQRARDQTGRRTLPHQFPPRWVQTHWRQRKPKKPQQTADPKITSITWKAVRLMLPCSSLVKAMMRIMARSMKRNWKSPKLLRICIKRKVKTAQVKGKTVEYRDQSSTYPIKQDDTDVLDDAVESHEFKDAEWRDEGGPSLPLENIIHW